MAKNSTHISCTSFDSHKEKNMKEKSEQGEVPSSSVIQNILNFSKVLRVKKSHEVGIVEFMLN
jgi:hypothetical protein